MAVDFHTAEQRAERMLFDLILEWTGDDEKRNHIEAEFIEQTFNYWIVALGVGAQPNNDHGRQIVNPQIQHRANAQWRGLFVNRDDLRQRVGAIVDNCELATQRNSDIEPICMLHRVSHSYNRVPIDVEGGVAFLWGATIDFDVQYTTNFS